jgi:IS5 family transposase
MKKKQRREFIKLHVSVDTKSKKIVTFRITSGNASDTKQFIPLLKDAKKKCRKIVSAHADKGYDDKNNFDELEKDKINPAIRIKKNASESRTKSRWRRKEIIYIHKYGLEKWKKVKNAGKRWIVEIVFSALKRVFGEKIFSKRFDAQCVEAGLKVLLYNKFLDT